MEIGKKKKYKMNDLNDNIWETKYTMKKNSPCIQYKFVFFSENLEKWESGENRLLCPNDLEGLQKTASGLYKLDLVWNYFHITFNLNYPFVPPDSIIQIGFQEAPENLEIWNKNNNKPIKMEYKKNKRMVKNNTEIMGMWTITIPVKNSLLNKNYLDFEYKYSLFNNKTNISILERGPYRKLRIFLNEKELYKEKDPYTVCFLLKNSKLEFVDINFVAILDFDKIGDKNIYIGVYPETEKDFELISKKGINSILSVQTDKDLEYRHLDINVLNKYANKYGINIERYPIEDFNTEDIYNNLKGAGDLLNKLLKEEKKIYVHCTAGIGRSSSVVITYLVLYENYSVKEAISFCKKYRPKIIPYHKIINEIAKIYKPGSEM